MLTRLFTAVQRFDEKGGKVEAFSKCRTEIGAVRFDYSGEPIQYMEELEAEKVLPCWPRPGKAAVQNARYLRRCKLGWMTQSCITAQGGMARKTTPQQGESHR